MRSHLLTTGWAGLLALSLCGCKLGPDYHRPNPLPAEGMPENFGETTNRSPGVEWKPAQPGAHLPRDAWWTVFQEPELNRLEDQAGTNNQQLVAAFARFQQARAIVGITRADLFPEANLDPYYTRQRTSRNQPQNGQPAGTAYTFNTFALPLTAGWEPDLWGRVRREVESARARLKASADDLESLRLAIQAELASDYFNLRFQDAEYDLVWRTTETYRRALELTVNRRKGGVASDLDVAQAETQLRISEAALPDLRLRRATLAHAVATLCGQAAQSLALATNLPPPMEPPAIPLALPSELLERRPDIAAAEQRMAAANAQVGVAQTAFFPRVRLTGLAGFQSISASTWFDWPSRVWAVGPSLQLPLFTGGRNRAQLALSRAAYDETVASYRNAVLSALQEVEDQIAAQRLLQAQLEAQRAAAAAANRTLEIAMNRYKAGLVTYLEVATAQSAVLSLERAVVQLRATQALAAVGLIRALGGGW